MIYKLVFERRALKQLKAINPAHIPTIEGDIRSLAENPRPQGYIKLKGQEAYRIRSGDYRIIYEIHDEIITIVVVDLGHRSSIYRRL